jgi:hypothetical protein
MFPGQKSGFRARFRPDANRENLKIGPPADFESAPDKNPADIRPRNPISGLEAHGSSGAGPARARPYYSYDAPFRYVERDPPINIKSDHSLLRRQADLVSVIRAGKGVIPGLYRDRTKSRSREGNLSDENMHWSRHCFEVCFGADPGGGRH